MSECPGWEQLAVPESWSAAQREHVAGCPRCSAWCREHAAFAGGDPAIPAAERAGAEARLGAFARELVGADREPLPAAGASWWSRLAAALAAPQVRFATAFAALALVAGVMVVNRSGELRPGEVARGADSSRAGVMRADAAGGVRLEWPVVPGADGYAVELLDADLGVLARFDTGTRAMLALDSAQVARAAFTRVVALRDGDRLVELAPLPLPAR